MKKIGIVTFHSSHNYGSVFQAYAMAIVLQKMGLDARIVDYRHPATTAAYEFVWWYRGRSLKANLSNLWRHGILRKDREREQNFNDFINKNLPLTERYTKKDDIKDEFDYLVCGSDQIWNPKASGRNSSVYYLDFGKRETIRFSYAASSGGEDFAKGHEKEIGAYLSSLKRIGVRENSMKEYIHHTFNMECTVNPDPTSLLEQDDWVRLEEPVENIPNKFLLVYSLRNMRETVLFAKEVGDRYNLPVIHINPKRGRKGNEKVAGVRSLTTVSPSQFLWLFHHATFIVTNTFHGNMFSIIYRKPFVWYKKNNDERILTLHEFIGLGELRQVSDTNKFDGTLLTMDYASIEKLIRNFKDAGLKYMKDCIR